MRPILVEALDADFISRIKGSKSNMDRVVRLALEKKEPGWEETDEGLITWKDQIYVPKNARL